MRLLLSLFTLLLALPAQAITPEELEARVQQIEQYRADRIGLKPPVISETDRRKSTTSVQTGVDSNGAIYGVGVLNVPIAQLWSALNDETRQSTYTAVSQSELVAGTKCQPGRKILQILEINIVFTTTVKWWVGIPNPNLKIMRNSGGAVRELAFSSSVDPSLIANAANKAFAETGSPIGYSKGAWFLVAVDARHTYVEYHAYSDPGSGVPSGIASRLAAGAIKDNFAAMATFASQGNPSCPIQ